MQLSISKNGSVLWLKRWLVWKRGTKMTRSKRESKWRKLIWLTTITSTLTIKRWMTTWTTWIKLKTTMTKLTPSCKSYNHSTSRDLRKRGRETKSRPWERRRATNRRHKGTYLTKVPSGYRLTGEVCLPEKIWKKPESLSERKRRERNDI